MVKCGIDRVDHGILRNAVKLEGFTAHLELPGIKHRFDLRPGAHSWEFRDQSLRDCLACLVG